MTAVTQMSPLQVKSPQITTGGQPPNGLVSPASPRQARQSQVYPDYYASSAVSPQRSPKAAPAPCPASPRPSVAHASRTAARPPSPNPLEHPPRVATGLYVLNRLGYSIFFLSFWTDISSLLAPAGLAGTLSMAALIGVTAYVSCDLVRRTYKLIAGVLTPRPVAGPAANGTARPSPPVTWLRLSKVVADNALLVGSSLTLLHTLPVVAFALFVVYAALYLFIELVKSAYDVEIGAWLRLHPQEPNSNREALRLHPWHGVMRTIKITSGLLLVVASGLDLLSLQMAAINTPVGIISYTLAVSSVVGMSITQYIKARMTRPIAG